MAATHPVMNNHSLSVVIWVKLVIHGEVASSACNSESQRHCGCVLCILPVSSHGIWKWHVVQGQDVIKLITLVPRQGHSLVKTHFFPFSECVAVKNTVTSSYFVSTSLVCVQACRHSHGGKQHFCIVLKIVLTSWTKENLRKFHGYWDGYKVIWSKLRIHVSALSL